ncbi:MAG: response regulator, partial [Candidatus Aminicenantes bacterium]|nr:response regulator [Candidatus Aminicenantes bacterium]
MAEKKTPTALIVDKGKSDLDSFRLMLEKEGLSVFTSENSESALSVINTFNINIALIDLNLGKENGMRVGEVIMKRSPETKVILF